jgi:hypothetical protein
LNFKYKCSDEDLDNDVDCLILARKYSDVRAKLVFEENNVSADLIRK